MTTPARRIGVVAATGIGVGSMLGAGVFSDMWAAVLDTGDWYLAAIALAALVALANALSTAQLASRYPVAGGAYAYGRAELGAFPGHVAGAAFLVGKTVSVAVGALVLGSYVLPGHAQWTATAAVALAWALNARGITKTATGATVIAVVVTLALVGIVCAAVVVDGEVPQGLRFAQESGPVAAFLVAASSAFFAFAGYARIATLGEEVREPARAIPRAIMVALAVVVSLYLAIAWALATYVGADALGALASRGQGAPGHDESLVGPIEQLAAVGHVPVIVVTVTAALATFGAMLAVMAGAGRTAMAMARERDLPAPLAAQGSSRAPWRAELVVALLAITLVWTSGANLLLVSVATVLTYYAVANLAAIRQRVAGRTENLRVPVVVSMCGLVASLALAGVALSASTDDVAPAMVVLALVVGWPAVSWVVRRRRA
ncbi:APC family permease [Demequina aurantiaca]|uniref:APC family permease n=1 Tax=Demequina aurantiaca TaxID=676200 RepID=UPI0007803D94|nr:APC family permease [Demequina aurantiaca]